jgi:molybdopterin synthase catalytic subunit/molybdopterin synthase sulfur carrier subunit
MKVSVRLFARARELAGAEILNVDLPVGATVRDLRHALVEVRPPLAPIAASLLVAVGADYAVDSTVLTEAARVACFPPVSGG